MKIKIFYCPELNEIFLYKNNVYITYDKDQDIKDAYHYVGYYLKFIGFL